MEFDDKLCDEKEEENERRIIDPRPADGVARVLCTLPCPLRSSESEFVFFRMDRRGCDAEEEDHEADRGEEGMSPGCRGHSSAAPVEADFLRGIVSSNLDVQSDRESRAPRA
mmetsp:Transcript_9624/g.27292  ORF Transcript_9624/g.27292 Transcript_9624/m.27292 type:complete len:112 (-) Transcript_9624:27-362(-)